ncbi:MAG: hypothetical protein HGB10_11085 [Coriobacteriia bacterium]|nr:hypothetical protein [Coriobacteriia bacterium]
MAARRGAHAFLLACVLYVGAALAPSFALALGPDAVRSPARSMVTSVPVGDDTSNLVVDLPFSMNWNGTFFSQIYINMNGNCTFGQTFTGYDPNPTLVSQNRNVMAPFWADVDTRNSGSGKVWYSDVIDPPLVDGHEAFIVTWSGVARYNQQASPLDHFQLVLIDRSDTGAGNFDFEFNYDQMTWDRGTTASTGYARAGWAINGGSSFELPGSNANGALLDSGAPATALIENSLNSDGQLGRYVWQVRNGGAPNAPPTITAVDRVLEGNTPGGYGTYDGTGDYTVTDEGAPSVTASPSLPATLPLGTTIIEWTALDAGGLSTTATQAVVVTDTTAPSAPSLSSATHIAGVWTNVPTATVSSVNSTDLCSGMYGARYSWTLDAPGAATATLETSTITSVTQNTVSTTTVDSQGFVSGTWPADWTRSSTTYVRLSATRFHNAANGAEVWANNTTRRTANFSKTFNLSAYDTATLSFWDYRTAFSTNADYELVRYSTNGGTSWTTLQQNLGTSSATPWTAHTYTLPAVANVLVQFGASVNATTEYVDWDEIVVEGFTTNSSSHSALSSVATTSLPDGSWYYNFRTRDVSGNWSATSSFGPVRIDRHPPSTVDDAPLGWATSPVTVSLTATDAGSGVATTFYRLNGGAVATYTAPFVVSIEQTNTLQYWSVDNRGNVETTKSVPVRVDTRPPTVPTSFSASAVTTTSVEMSWNPSTDTTSGLSYYRIFADGSLVATSTETTYELTDLTAGQTYVFNVAAVDVAGNVSAASTTDTETMPQSQLWLTIEPTAIDLGAMDPGDTTTVTDATTITVGGVGDLGYTLSLYGEDFTSTATATPVPTMTVSALSYQMSGWGSQPWTPNSTTTQTLAIDTGAEYVWLHPYHFDFRLDIPWDASPGAYASRLTYTVVAN